jgi:hypothetical protein
VNEKYTLKILSDHLILYKKLTTFHIIKKKSYFIIGYDLLEIDVSK